MATFALATGLRAANITGLTWEQVDLPRKQAWVHPDQAKARRAIPVPFNEAALEVVTRQQGKHPVHVFTYEATR
jgi:integrase